MDSGSGLELGRLVRGPLCMAVAHGRDLDLAGLQLLRLWNLEPQDAMLERCLGLIGLEAVRQGHGPAEVAATDLLKDVAAFVGRALVGRLAADRHGAILD